jgi:tartrate-resistant acid phosphatase type 5
VRIAVIGDYGLASPAERDVSDLVKGWRPDAVITTGDNNYPSGSAATIDMNIGQFYSEFIYPYEGSFGTGADCNRFFPVLGNHDWVDPAAAAYLDYFTLPGNERYYDFVIGDVHLFAVDSMPDEPDGITVDSRQAAWLRDGLAVSSSPWNLVTMHHPSFSSGPHGSTPRLQWPFAAWGATAVLAGHDHIYERITRDGIPYFVNGLGGSIRYAIGDPVEGSQARYGADFGAMLIEADSRQIAFSFVARSGEVVDTYTVTR